MRQVMPQMGQRGHQPVDEHQLVAGADTSGPLPGSSSRSVASALESCLPRRRQLLYQAGEMLSIMPPAWHDASPAITHQLVNAHPRSSR